MTWVRLDDGFADDPRFLKAGPLATTVAIWALCYSSRHLTDGFVARESLLGCTWVADKSQRSRCYGRLEVAGFWVRTDDGFQIIEPFQYLQKAAQVKESRAAAAERQRAYREKKQRPRNGVTNASTSATVTPSPTRPDPEGVEGRVLDLDPVRAPAALAFEGSPPLDALEDLGPDWCTICAEKGDAGDEPLEHVFAVFKDRAAIESDDDDAPLYTFRRSNALDADEFDLYCAACLEREIRDGGFVADANGSRPDGIEAATS